MNFEIYPAIIQTTAIVILVIATLWYAKITRDILEDNQREKRIKLIQHKLENLYAPLRNNMEIINQYHLILDSRHPKNEQYVNFISEIKKYTYLGSKELQTNLKIFFDGLDNHIGIENDEDEKKKFNEARKEIKLVVDKEYEKLSKELIELVQ